MVGVEIMKYFKDLENELYALEDHDASILDEHGNSIPTHFVKDGWIEITEDEFNTLLTEKNTPTIEQLKAAKKIQIESDRDAACFADVTALGRTWSASKRNQELLNNAITLTSDGASLPSYWRDTDNNNMEITEVSQLVAISSAIAAQTQAAYVTSWSRKQALESAMTAEEIQAI